MKALVKRFIEDERGLETIEWTLMAALIVLGLVGGITLLQTEIKAIFTALQGDLASSH